MSKNIAVIFAGGSGVRMGAGKPKQFLEIDGRPIIIYTLDIFEDHPLIDEIYIACKEDYIGKMEKLVKRYGISKVKAIVPGGTTALGSQYNGLAAAKAENEDDAIVLIHDGVRPCINESLINDVIEMTKERGAVATAQAPQCFRLGDILEAHEKVRGDNPEYVDIVDSCTLLRSIGRDVAILKGPRSNIKVTTPEDLYIFKAMLEYKRNKDNLG